MRLLLLPCVLFVACAPAPGECVALSGASDASRAVCEALDAHAPGDAAFLAGDASGRLLEWSRGDIGQDTPVRLASASKWLAAAVVMSLVDDGTLDLAGHASDHLPFWSTDDARADVTLEHLLSFTAGFRVKPGASTCAGDDAMTMEECARKIHDEDHVDAPGTTFYYGPAPLQVAGAIVERAEGASFHDVFRSRIADPLGMSDDASFDRQNVRVAGGGVASAADYELFLRALLDGTLLPTQQETLDADRTPEGEVELLYSPVEGQGFEWHYALGHWRECISSEWQASCDEHVVVSSPGAFGFFPWIDRENGVYGVLAVETLLGHDEMREGLLELRPRLTEL